LNTHHVDRHHVAAVARRYSEDAPLYERYWAPSMAELARRLVSRLPLRDASVAVDIGAGVGALLPGIREAAPRAFVAGVDASEGMIRRASPDFGRAVMDAGRLALRDNSVDVATMPFMLFFLPDPPRGIAEGHRVLRPGGGLGVATWEAGTNDFQADNVWFDLLDEHGAVEDVVSSMSERMDTPERLAKLLLDGGFRDVRTATDREPLPLTVDDFLVVRTRIGRSRLRFESLDPEVRTEVVARARERLVDLPPEDITDPQVAVFAWGTKPD
jgi:ubiquinone/menaquinone biosynthesis C-methylase UbiE